MKRGLRGEEGLFDDLLQRINLSLFHFLNVFHCLNVWGVSINKKRGGGGGGILKRRLKVRHSGGGAS
jgi:hypothetical protein